MLDYTLARRFYLSINFFMNVPSNGFSLFGFSYFSEGNLSAGFSFTLLTLPTRWNSLTILISVSSSSLTNFLLSTTNDWLYLYYLMAVSVTYSFSCLSLFTSATSLSMSASPSSKSYSRSLIVISRRMYSLRMLKSAVACSGPTALISSLIIASIYSMHFRSSARPSCSVSPSTYSSSWFMWFYNVPSDLLMFPMNPSFDGELDNIDRLIFFPSTDIFRGSSPLSSIMFESINTFLMVLISIINSSILLLNKVFLSSASWYCLSKFLCCGLRIIKSSFNLSTSSYNLTFSIETYSYLKSVDIF